MNKIVSMFLLFAILFAGVASAEDLYIEGNSYKGQPIACLAQKDAADLAEVYVHEGLDKLESALVQKNAKNLCVAGIKVEFTVIRSVSTHKYNKEIVHVIEILSSGVYYIIDPRPVVSRLYQKGTTG